MNGQRKGKPPEPVVGVHNRAHRVRIVRLDNGYMVESDFVGAECRGHYCSNLKGVTAELYSVFEGKSKLRKDQVEFIRGTAEAKKDTDKEEKSDA